VATLEHDEEIDVRLRVRCLSARPGAVEPDRAKARSGLALERLHRAIERAALRWAEGGLCKSWHEPTVAAFAAGVILARS